MYAPSAIYYDPIVLNSQLRRSVPSTNRYVPATPHSHIPTSAFKIYKLLAFETNVYVTENSIQINKTDTFT